MFTIIGSQDRPKQLAEIAKILADSELLEAREFPNGATISRYANASGVYACTVMRADNHKLWMSGDYSAIVDKYNFLVRSNLQSE